MMRHTLWICALLPALLLPCLAGGAEPLLIAVASDDVESTSIVSNYAVRSQYYLLFSGINMVEVVRNPFLDKGVGGRPPCRGLPCPKRGSDSYCRGVRPAHDRSDEEKGHEILSVFGYCSGRGRKGGELPEAGREGSSRVILSQPSPSVSALRHSVISQFS